MIKQVILDMENQYMQVKTQVAVSIADQHMLEKKQKENEDAGADWMRKAERSVDKQQDDLARAALDRYQTSQRLAQSYKEQVDDQKAQVEALKGALMKLEQKLDEAKSKRDMLHRASSAQRRAQQSRQSPRRARRRCEKRRLRSLERPRQPIRIGRQRRSRTRDRRRRRSPDSPRPRHRSRAPADRPEISAGFSRLIEIAGRAHCCVPGKMPTLPRSLQPIRQSFFANGNHIRQRTRAPRIHDAHQLVPLAHKQHRAISIERLVAQIRYRIKPDWSDLPQRALFNRICS